MREDWLKTIYISKKSKDLNGNDIINDYGKVQYDRAQPYKWNVQPLSGTCDTTMYGQKSKGMQVAVVDLQEYFGVFHEGDKVYLDGANPTGESSSNWGANANYIIDAILNQNKKIRIYFDKIQTKK